MYFNFNIKKKLKAVKTYMLYLIGVYENFPDVLICRGRGKYVVSTSRPIRTYKLCSTDAGT